MGRGKNQKLLACLAVFLLASVCACKGAGIFGFSKVKSEESDDSTPSDEKRPHEPGEGLPGYLTDHSAISYQRGEDLITVTGGVGVVATDGGAVESVLVCLQQTSIDTVTTGINEQTNIVTPLETLSTTIAAADGSFQMSVGASKIKENYLLIINVSGNCDQTEIPVQPGQEKPSFSFVIPESKGTFVDVSKVNEQLELIKPPDDDIAAHPKSVYVGTGMGIANGDEFSPSITAALDITSLTNIILLDRREYTVQPLLGHELVRARAEELKGQYTINRLPTAKLEGFTKDDKFQYYPFFVYADEITKKDGSKVRFSGPIPVFPLPIAISPEYGLADQDVKTWGTRVTTSTDSFDMVARVTFVEIFQTKTVIKIDLIIDADQSYELYRQVPIPSEATYGVDPAKQIIKEIFWHTQSLVQETGGMLWQPVETTVSYHLCHTEGWGGEKEVFSDCP